MNAHYSAVAARASHRCEYCRAPEAFFNFPFEVEHVVPLSREGGDEVDNLALACRACNSHKSNFQTGLDEITKTETALFNPRFEEWASHFTYRSEDGHLVGLTPRGRATIFRLNLNRPSQIQARLLWAGLGFYP